MDAVDDKSQLFQLRYVVFPQILVGKTKQRVVHAKRQAVVVKVEGHRVLRVALAGYIDGVDSVGAMHHDDGVEALEAVALEGDIADGSASQAAHVPVDHGIAVVPAVADVESVGGLVGLLHVVHGEVVDAGLAHMDAAPLRGLAAADAIHLRAAGGEKLHGAWLADGEGQAVAHAGHKLEPVYLVGGGCRDGACGAALQAVGMYGVGHHAVVVGHRALAETAVSVGGHEVKVVLGVHQRHSAVGVEVEVVAAYGQSRHLHQRHQRCRRHAVKCYCRVQCFKAVDVVLVAGDGHRILLHTVGGFEEEVALEHRLRALAEGGVQQVHAGTEGGYVDEQAGLQGRAALAVVVVVVEPVGVGHRLRGVVGVGGHCLGGLVEEVGLRRKPAAVVVLHLQAQTVDAPTQRRGGQQELPAAVGRGAAHHGVVALVKPVAQLVLSLRHAAKQACHQDYQTSSHGLSPPYLPPVC